MYRQNKSKHSEHVWIYNGIYTVGFMGYTLYAVYISPEQPGISLYEADILWQCIKHADTD